MDRIGSDISSWDKDSFAENKNKFEKIINQINLIKDKITLGGGENKIQKQHDKGRLTARERILHLIDSKSDFLEVGIMAGYEMYNEFGSPAAAGVVAGIGKILNHDCMIIANDATVKAGAYFEISLSKTLHCQKIALQNNLPVIYLVDSAGIFLPLQNQVFAGEQHFGRIFYNNARMSALGITQIACVMGPCVAGGAYLPVMCDKYIIVEGASMFLAGPALVKAAIGQEVDQETLGGAETHSSISGTTDYHVKDDLSAISKIKDIISSVNFNQKKFMNVDSYVDNYFEKQDLLGIFNPANPSQYDVKEVIARIIDDSKFMEFKSSFGKTIICGNAKIGGYSVGIVANQKLIDKNYRGELQMGGVIYSESADKASRFIMNCNQDRIPIIFIHDVNGFMVGKDSEWGGIAKDGAKMVNAVSNSVVPKITLITGGSYGAGNYAMSGRSYESRFVYAWPSSKIAVMGGDQAAKTLLQINLSKKGAIDKEIKDEMYKKIKSRYDQQSDIKYAAARLWVDEVIDPRDTRRIFIRSLEIINNQEKCPSPKFGVFQV